MGTEAEGDALLEEGETTPLRVVEAVMDAVEGEAPAIGVTAAAAVVEGEVTSMGASGLAIKAVTGAR